MQADMLENQIAEEEHCDVLVIGAGPGGLCSALHLAQVRPDLNVLVLDEGRGRNTRYCPVDSGKTCKGCHGVCNVFSGFGGSIHYGDGIKLSKYPSGRRIFELIGLDKVDSITEKALDILNIGHSNSFVATEAKSDIYNIKRYDVAPISGGETSRILDDMYGVIVKMDNLSVRTSTKVAGLRITGDGFRASCVQKVKGRVASYGVSADRVVVATGRKGFEWWRDEMRSLGLRYEPPVMSFGLRFETVNENLSGASEMHSDMKIGLEKEGFKFKTFCFCAGDGGGRIKFTDYGDFVLLDGHLIVDREEQKPVSNFALLCQLRGASGEPLSYTEVRNNILDKYINLNKDRGGKPLAQWYRDFRSRTLVADDIDHVVEMCGHQLSVTDLTPARLDSLIADDMHSAYCDAFEELALYFASLSNNNACEYVLDSYVVMGLELESIWDVVDVSTWMESSVQGVYVVGDCSGIAQGILQAAVAGVRAAQHISLTLGVSQGDSSSLAV